MTRCCDTCNNLIDGACILLEHLQDYCTTGIINTDDNTSFVKYFLWQSMEEPDVNFLMEEDMTL
jgi:hypothetical protein